MVFMSTIEECFPMTPSSSHDVREVWRLRMHPPSHEDLTMCMRGFSWEKSHLVLHEGQKWGDDNSEAL